MPALLINIKIDLREKFDLFKVTLSDLSGLFEEKWIRNFSNVLFLAPTNS